MTRLFGTDGIRGKANHYPVTPEVALQAGRALVRALAKTGGNVRVLIGKDTRISCDMLECAVAAGVCSAGGSVHMCGVIPTPAAAYLTTKHRLDAGIVISASHNPFFDNGIKFFNKEGFKLSPDIEALMERVIQEKETGAPEADSGKTGIVLREPSWEADYTDFLVRTAGPGAFLEGYHLVLDCANGATFRAAPSVFERLGAKVKSICISPDGTNINQGCGSQYTDQLRRKVVEEGADAGLAFDGDGDRLIAVDETGRSVTGDQVLAVCAKHLKEKGGLTGNRVVSTVMSNVGLHRAMAELDIELIITDVGDRNVLAQMRNHGAVIGGEDSGHTIFLDAHTSGDGIMTGLQLLKVMQETGKRLSELASLMKVYPQVLKNVEVEEKTDIYQIPEIRSVIDRVEQELGGQGRVLVRYSGTQALCRIMVEGPDPDQTERLCTDIVDMVKTKIGA
jgi:phosphoglucosamine mutase